MRRAGSIGTIALAAALIGGACASEPGTGQRVGSGAGAGAGGSSGSAGVTGGSSGMPLDGGLGALPGVHDGGPNLDDACAFDKFTAKTEPLDLFIMLDQSSSMDDPLPAPATGTLWTAVTSALKNFLNLPESSASGMRVGIGYFGILTGGPNLESSCDPADYAAPSVPIAALAGNITPLVDSINQHYPSTFTPTRPALEGALSYARAWAANNPDRLTVVVLATDGNPTECDTSLSGMRDLAAQAAAGNPRVLTFIIGIGGSYNLDSLAQAGGTVAPFIVNSSPTIEQDFAQAMRSIATTTLACELSIPPPPAGQTLQPNLVNLRFTPSQLPSEILVKVNVAADCGQTSRGWYYDNNVAPTSILLCPGACAGLGEGTLEVLVGCQSYTGPT